MDSQTRAKAKRLLTAISVVWLILVGWLAFFAIPRNELLTINSEQVKERMRDECTGSYQNRYDCKEAIIVQTGQDAFAGVILRLTLALGGPLLAIAVYRFLCRPDGPPRPMTAAPEAAAGDWKERAISATSGDGIDRSKEPTLDPQPPPEDDWKRRAQERIAAAKLPPPGPPDWLIKDEG